MSAFFCFVVPVRSGNGNEIFPTLQLAVQQSDFMNVGPWSVNLLTRQTGWDSAFCVNSVQ